MNCYLCLNRLTKENISFEHIIPDSIGGQIGSNGLICKACNNKLGHGVDAKLVEQLLPVARIIGVKRSRGKKDSSVLMLGDKGSKLIVGKHFTPRPKIYIDFPDGKSVSINPKTDKEFERLVKAKKAEMFKKHGTVKVHEDLEYHTEETFDFAGLPDYIGGKEYFLGITKIAVNFMLYKGLSSKYAQTAIDLIKGDKKYNDVSYYYYPGHYTPYFSGEKEISHVLYLRADTEKRVLFMYVELFNADNFLIVLSTDYFGENFEETYIWDTASDMELDGSVKIKLTRQHFLDIEIFARSTLYEDRHNERRKVLLRKLEDLQS